jgi:hypothetical protein
MVKTPLDNEKQILFSIEKQASILPNVTSVISPLVYVIRISLLKEDRRFSGASATQ